DAVLASRHAGQSQTIAGVQTQYSRSDRLRLRRARHARLCISPTKGLAVAYGSGGRVDVAVCRSLRGRMGTSHEFHGGKKMSGTGHALFATRLLLWRSSRFKYILRKRMLAT